MATGLEEMGKDAIVEPLEVASQLSQAATIDIFQWWLQNRDAQSDCPVPYWKSFDVIEFATYSNRMSVSERQQDGSFKYKLQGEHVLDVLGRDRLKHMDVRGDHEQVYERDLFHYYDMICTDLTPHVFKGTLPTIDKGHVQIESVDLPFKDENGDVNKILSILQDFK
ncbi:PAS domain-containing protein [Curvivirga sp.]|uniref:PAS domain-containing protein n=1 Tax=Curvivirga sp. TaxID=2856848 RepID=UPI003B58BB61